MLLAAVVALDGVLFDLGALRAAAVRDALAAEGVRVGGAAAAHGATVAADAGEEAGVRAALAHAANEDGSPTSDGDEVTVALAAHRAERLVSERLQHGGAVLAEGAVAAVDALGGRLRLAAVTTLRRSDALRLLDAAGLAPAFGTLGAGDDRPVPARGTAESVDAGNSAWAAVLARLAARVPHLTPDRVVAFTASAAGSAAARAAGARVVRIAAIDGAPDGAHARLRTLAGLTPAALACALDLAPAPRPIR